MICIDTMVLIWGVQQKASLGQEAMIDRTGRWLRSLAGNERIMLPSVAMSEYLMKFSGVDRQRQLALLQQRFFIPSLDVPAAALAAELRGQAKAANVQIDREVMKSDCYIIATAIIHGASVIVTENRSEFQKLASGRIKISAVPDVPEQMELRA